MSWHDCVTQLKGVGKAKAELLAQIGITTIKDAMFHFPFRYEDYEVRELTSLLDQEKVTLKGTIVTPPVVNYYGHKKNRLTFKMAGNDHDVIQVMFFNQPYLKQTIQLGQEKVVHGKWQAAKQTLLGMKVLNMANDDGEDYVPVYRSTKGLRQSTLVSLIQQAFAQYGEGIPELLPQVTNDKYRLMSLREALPTLHFSKEESAKHQAKRKIIFQEFFLYQWRLQQARLHQRQETGVRVLYDVSTLKETIQQLPYELTMAQKRAVNEICYDLMAPYPMKRLLQGDVGSGKTLVAFLAMMATVQAGYQAALMVPTEILAKQHAESFQRFFGESGVSCALLVSAMTASSKRMVLEGLANGEIDCVIGTHAIIQETVQFKQLGLAIIDEQHRFGVAQRQALLQKGKHATVNVLQMTATPIPRSLAMALYGELSVSTIDERPKGRQPIITELVEEERLEELYDLMDGQLSQGRQIYYVLPLIESSEHFEQIENVMETYEKLSQRFKQYRVDVLHGQLDKESQQQVMDDFTHNKVHILVATTMVEVGVDVPNATVIVIQSAERFGLAQLHQLRGRVGRSDLQSYCYLIANPTTEQGKSRLQIMVDEQDGFAISQSDMKIRGMGDLLGRVQSGLPQFHYANIIEDQHILAVARQEVTHLLQHAHEVTTAEWEQLNDWATTQEIEM